MIKVSEMSTTIKLFNPPPRPPPPHPTYYVFYARKAQFENGLRALSRGQAVNKEVQNKLL